MKPGAYVVQPIAAAMAMTGGKQNEAILFFAAWDFYRYSKALNNGVKVIIQTDDELCQRTGLKFAQIRRAKRRLKKWGFLETEVKKSPKYHGGLTVTHIHVPDGVMKLMENVIRGNVQICTVGNEQNCIGQYVHGCTLPLYIEVVSKSKGKAAPETEEQDCSSDEENELAELKEALGV